MINDSLIENDHNKRLLENGRHLSLVESMNAFFESGDYENLRLYLLNTDVKTAQDEIANSDIYNLFNDSVAKINERLSDAIIPQVLKDKANSILSSIKIDDLSIIHYKTSLSLIEPFKFDSNYETVIIQSYYQLYTFLEMIGLNINSFREYIGITDKDGLKYRFFSNGCYACLTPVGQLFDIGGNCARIIEPSLLAHLYQDTIPLVQIPRPSINDYNVSALVLKNLLSYLSNDVGKVSNMVSNNPLTRVCFGNRSIMRVLTRSSCSVIDSNETHFLHMAFIVQTVNALRAAFQISDETMDKCLYVRTHMYKSFRNFITEE